MRIKGLYSFAQGLEHASQFIYKIPMMNSVLLVLCKNVFGLF
jgi:hypothetical protein